MTTASIIIFAPALLTEKQLWNQHSWQRPAQRAFARMQIAASDDHFPQQLSQALAVDFSKIPYAAFMALAENLINQYDYWLCAEPVECRADAKTVHMLGNQHLALSRAESVALINTVNEFLQQDGLHLQRVSADHWLINVAEDPKVISLPPSLLLGKDIYAYLPQDNAKYWRTLQTEIQMLLHDHPVNSNRQAMGLPRVNNLWFYGSGKLPTMKSQVPITTIYGHALWMQGLAKWLAVPFHPLQRFIDCENINEQVIIFDERLAAIPSIEVLQQFEKQIWLPALSLLNNQKIDHITLYTNQYCGKLTSKIYRRWLSGYWQKTVKDLMNDENN